MLSVADKASIALGLLEFLRGYPLSDEEPFSAWLKRTKQTDRAIRHFWEPVIVGTLNDTFDRCSTRYAGQVFHESFMKSAEGGRLGIPAQPLSEFYTAVAQLAEKQGTSLHLRTSIDRIESMPDGAWTATASDGSIYRAGSLVLALPFEQTARLVGTLPEESIQRQRILPAMDHFTHSPITTIHLWFDRVITELDHAALLDTRIQWMFNKSRIRRFEESAVAQPGQYLELVISASFAELHRTREEIVSAAVEELAVPVFFHPDDVAGGERLDDFYLGRLIGNPHEATLSLARIILGGVLEQFPGLKLCFPMGGGSIAYLLGRIRHGWEVRPEAKVQAPKSPDEYLRQCYFDTVLHSQEAFDFLVSVVPPEQLVMGSDYPWDMGLEHPREAIEDSAAITAEQKRGVLSGNIERLLGNGTADSSSTDGAAVQRSQAL